MKKDTSNIVRLNSVRQRIEARKAEIGQPKKPLYPADLLPLMEEMETLVEEVIQLRSTVSKLLRLLKAQTASSTPPREDVPHHKTASSSEDPEASS